jgi:hypothetical protein
MAIVSVHESTMDSAQCWWLSSPKLTLPGGSSHVGSPAVGENEEGAQEIITVALEGGRVAWFGSAAGRRRR